MGRHLIPRLLERGHEVTAVARPGSEGRLAAGTRVISGDVLDAGTYRSQVRPEHVFVQLVGVAHPSPAKARQFVDVDQRSAEQAIMVARAVGVRRFVYVSVAHPAPAMHAYIAARSACEEAIQAAGLPTTILRPWYVLGPGHQWPQVLRPFYWLAERTPRTAETSRRLGLLTIGQMTRALVYAVEYPEGGSEILEVPRIRAVAANFA